MSEFDLIDPDEEEVDHEEGEWAFEVDESDAPVIAAKQRSTPKYPSEPGDGQTWREYFQGVKARDVARKRRAEVVAPVLAGTNDDVDPTKLPLSPKKTYGKASKMGWTITLRESTIHHADKFQMKDGKVRKDGTQVMAGELVTAAHDETVLGMTAASEPYRTGFFATWLDGRFVSAKCVDPVGFPRYLNFAYPEGCLDYSITFDSMYERRAKKLHHHPERAYNDNQQHTFPSEQMTAGKRFDDWLWDWMETMISGFERPKPKEKKIVPTFEEKLLAGAEWSAE